MSVFSAMDISATGMTAQRTRLDLISENIANVNTTRTADGDVYKRKAVVFEEILRRNPAQPHPILKH